MTLTNQLYNIYYNVFEEKQLYKDSVLGKAKTKSKAVVQALKNIKVCGSFFLKYPNILSCSNYDQNLILLA